MRQLRPYRAQPRFAHMQLLPLLVTPNHFLGQYPSTFHLPFEGQLLHFSLGFSLFPGELRDSMAVVERLTAGGGDCVLPDESPDLVSLTPL